MVVVRTASGTPEQTEGRAAVVSGEVEKMPVHAVQQVETFQCLPLEAATFAGASFPGCDDMKT